MKPHQVFGNTIINIFNTGVNFIIAFIMTPIILDRLGTEAYGLWAFLGIFSITGFFSLLDFGFQGAAIKYIAEFFSKKDRYNLHQTINATLVFFLLIGIIGGFMLFLFNQIFLLEIFNLPSEQHAAIIFLVNLLAFSFLFQFPGIAYSAILEGLQKYGYLRGISLGTSILSHIFIFLFLPTHNGLYWLIFITIVTSLITMIAYAITTKKLLPDLKIQPFKIESESLRLLFAFSLKLFISRIVSLIFNNTDKILIGIFLTVVQQTEYDIANKIHIMLLSIASIMNQAVLPATAEMAGKNETSMIKMLLLRGTKYSALLVFPSFIFIFIFIQEFLKIWVGDSFIFLTGIVQLYIIHFTITAFVGISSTMLIGINKVGKGLQISVWAAILNLAISLITIKMLGITGLILGTTVAYAISSLIYIKATDKIFKIPHILFLKETVLPLLPAAVITTVSLITVKTLFTPDSRSFLLLILILSYILFMGIFYIVGLTREEKNLGRALLSRWI